MSPDAFTPHQAPKSTGALKDGAIRLPYGPGIVGRLSTSTNTNAGRRPLHTL